MQLEGNIRDFPLSELLTLIADSAISGMLEIEQHADVGRIFCRDGRVYHVELREHCDYAALDRLIEWNQASFRFIAGVEHGTETFWPSRQALIGYVRRAERLHRQMRRYIPRLDWIPVLCAFRNDTSVRLSTAIWPILAAVDGQRSVAEIAALIGQEPLEIGVAVSDLIGRGLAYIKPPRAFPDDIAPATSADEEDTAGSFFEWLLTGRTDQRPAIWFARSLS
ncbi:MAG TPA: DUF4388 domain-containing protein [Roseiflexaceae bacterium]|nr:DUF4388 domain-containing protein [Roseiflexaceae bacterium]